VVIGTELATRTVEWVHEPAGAVVPRIRQHVRALLAVWGVDVDRIADAVLVVEELVANVVDHARTRFRLVVDLTGSLLRLAVRDDSDRCPDLAPHDPAAVRGRGLQLIAALTLRWGYDRHDQGKTVWAVLPT
jgi:anti-sigma regulatory factor (Ser/Thr protein kinase)